MDARLMFVVSISPPLIYSSRHLSHACLRLRAAYRRAFLVARLARLTGEAQP